MIKKVEDLKKNEMGKMVRAILIKIILKYHKVVGKNVESLKIQSPWII